jgi:hypothetical protein
MNVGHHALTKSQHNGFIYRSTSKGGRMRKMHSAIGAVLVIGLIILSASLAMAEITFDSGAAVRVRQEIWDNIVTLGTSPTAPGNYDRNFFRVRTQAWGKIDVDKTFETYFRLTNELKYYTGPYRLPQNAGVSTVYRAMEEDEIFVDNLYAEYKNIFGIPIDIKIGRQDFLGEFGDGFLILDGTPGDGSRSYFFNAAKMKIRPHQNHSVTLVLLRNSKTDIFMPVVHSSIVQGNYFQDKRVLNVSDESGFIVYSKNKFFDFLSIEPYYMWKSEDKFIVPGSSQVTPRLNINTVGGRIEAKPGNWTIKAELAHQFGTYSNGVDRKANGGQTSIAYAFKELPFKPELEVGYVYLSGDDPNTPGINETWDPLWSRAPMWNELCVYTLINETLAQGGAVTGYWTNMHMLRINTKLFFSNMTNLALGYNYMLAPEKTNLTANTTLLNMFSNTGKNRGSLYQAMLNHAFSKKIDGFLQLEHFLPGDFYNSNARNATFFRWQLQVKL